MKKVFFAAALIGLTFAACSDDDDQATVNASVDGTWKLTGFTLDEAVDFNNDGTESTNLISETGCYNNSKIEFIANAMAMVTLQELDVTLDGPADNMVIDVTCGAGETFPSAYVVTDNSVVLDEGTEEEVVLIRNGNTLSVHFPEVTDVPVEGTNGEVTYDAVGATLTFTKQ